MHENSYSGHPHLEFVSWRNPGKKLYAAYNIKLVIIALYVVINI